MKKLKALKRKPCYFIEFAGVPMVYDSLMNISQDFRINYNTLRYYFKQTPPRPYVDKTIPISIVKHTLYYGRRTNHSINHLPESVRDNLNNPK